MIDSRINPQAARSQIELVRDWALRNRVPPWAEQTAPQAREIFREAAGIKLTGPPPEVARVQTVSLAASGGPLQGRVYTPEGGASDAVLLYVHGGGYMVGGLEEADAEVRRLARAMSTPVISFRYRLAPEHPWPAAIEDVVDVVRLIAGGGLGKAPRRIALMGVSAGAGLAAAATRRLAASGDNPVELLALLSPWLDLTLSSPSATLYGTGFFQELSQLADFADAYAPAGADRAHPEMSPARHPVTPGWPRTILLAAELDPLADDAALFARRLAEAQVPHDIRYARGMLHGFHTWWHRIDIEEDLAWLDDRLRAWAATG